MYRGQNWGLENVGVRVGRDEGSNVGTTDGIGEGWSVGEEEGCAVGDTVGMAVVGTREGVGVGGNVAGNLVTMKRPVQEAVPVQPWYIFKLLHMGIELAG